MENPWVENLFHLPNEIVEQRLIETIGQVSPEELVKGLKEITDLASQHHNRGEHLLLIFLKRDDLITSIGYDKLAAVYELAGFESLEYIQAMLIRTSLASHQKNSVPLPEWFQDEEPPKLVKQLESYTLGERRQFAKKNDLRKLEMLLFDSDSVVVTNLLSNPRIVEPQVLKIASLRPQSGEALRAIFMHPKWSNRYPVRKALVANASTPVHIASGLVHLLRKQDLQVIIEAAVRLNPIVLNRARQLLKEKKD